MPRANEGYGPGAWHGISSAEGRHNIADGRATSPLSEEERFNLLLGITCRTVYHAGQVQLIKRLIVA